MNGPEAQHFLQLADLLPETMLLLSGDGTIVAANRSAVARLGASASDLSGRALSGFVADPSDKLQRYLRECSRSRQLVLGSLSLLHDGNAVPHRAEGGVYRPRHDGSPPLVMLRLLPHKDTVQRFLLLNERIAELNREIARRREYASALYEHQEWLRVLIESIGDAVIATDERGKVTLMNPVAETLTGLSLGEARDLPLPEVFHIINEETRAPAENPVEKVLRLGTLQGLANHTLLISRNGHELPIDDCASPIRDAQGALRGVVLVFHDITERRNLERELTLRAERLAESDRRKDEFLAMLAHELRNPLAPIRNALYILGIPEVSPAVQERSRRMIERQIHNMVRLVDDLLDVSRITRGKVHLHLEEMDLVAVAARASEATQPLAEARDLRFSASLPSRPLWITADSTRLDQVLVNLLNNAIKFTPPGGGVELIVQRQGREAVVTVHDTGEGIPPELLPHIFEPFTQANRSLDRSQGGLGLGLTLAWNLVELHGGRIEVSSAVGEGSTFTVRLPLSPDPTGDRPGDGW